MIEHLLDYGLFLAKTVTIVIALMILLGLIAHSIREARAYTAEHLQVKNLNRRFENLAGTLEDELQSDAQRKQQAKQKKRDKKQRAKEGPATPRSRVFVIKFHGDIRASAVDNLREEISAVVQVAKPEDEVLLRLESQGGMVHTYGLAASQLMRLKTANIKLTAAVDQVAASGGYLMACVADRIIAAPFAIIGSIGVVAQLPNFNRLLKEHKVDYELHTAGDYKRTLTLFGENTEAAREKFREELEDTHRLFKSFVIQNRPQLDIEKVATGEHWYGTQALDRQLIDGIQTSDDYLLKASKDREVLEVTYKRRKPLQERLASSIRSTASGILGLR